MDQEKLASEIYQRYQSRLKRYITQRIDRQEDVEEILQDSLLSAVNSFPLFSKKSAFYTWLCGIARHEIADFYRKKKIKIFIFSRLPFLESLADKALGPEEKIIEEELKRKVKTVLVNLNEGYQVVLRLKYVEGYSMAEIASRLGLTLKAVESRLSRARLAFREAWMVDKDEKLRRKIRKDCSETSS